MARAPSTVSSDGWPTSIRVPCQRDLAAARDRATPIRTVEWMS